MKTKITILLIIITLLTGCVSQDSLTWTPTSEEWSTMSPTEKNQWYITEMAAHQRYQQDYQNLFRGLGEAYLESQQPQPIIPLNSPYIDNYWQERYYQQKLLEGPKYHEPLNELSKKYRYNP